MKTTAWKTLCLVSAVIAACLAGCTPEAKSPPPAKPSLEGAWSGTEEGSPQTILITFTGNQFAYTDAQSNPIGSGTFVVSEEAQPMEMDLTFVQIASPEYVGKVGLAIYRFEGDQLIIAGSEPGTGERPKEFTSGSGVRLFTFTRK